MSQAVAEGLRAQGVEAASSHEVGNDGLTDEEQLSYAATRGWVLVSYNRNDFLALAARWFAEGKPFAGVILLLERRFPRREVGRQVKGLVYFNGHCAESIENAVVFLPLPPV